MKRPIGHQLIVYLGQAQLIGQQSASKGTGVITQCQKLIKGQNEISKYSAIRGCI